MSRGMRKSLLIFLCILGAAASPRARVEDNKATLEGELQRLSEILGALHYLRAICGANEARNGATKCGINRAEAQALTGAASYAASFNRGYRGFQQTYRACTPAADIAIRRYLTEAQNRP